MTFSAADIAAIKADFDRLAPDEKAERQLAADLVIKVARSGQGVRQLFPFFQGKDHLRYDQLADDPGFKNHQRILGGYLRKTVNNLHEEQRLREDYRALGVRHIALNVRKEHLESLGKALMEKVRRAGGNEAAWEKLTDLITKEMAGGCEGQY